MSKTLRPGRLWPAAVAIAAMGAWAAAPQNLSRALDTQRAMVAAQPGNAAAQVDLGNLLLLAGHGAEAEAAYRQAVALDPKSITGHFDLGLLLQRQGKNSEALKSFKAVLELEPKHAWAQYRIGEIEERRGLDGAAVRHYARAFALDPTLRFPDVNPSVIDNHLLTQSLLLAYRDYAPEREPPVVFEEPQRIVSLLLSNPKTATDNKPADGKSAAGGAAVTQPRVTTPTATPGAAATAAPGDPKAPAGKDPAFVRVLSAQDLDPSSRSGQVGGGSAAVPGAPRAYGNDPRNAYYPPPAYTQPQRPPEEGQPPATYYPGPPSTGRLDLKLYHRKPRSSSPSATAPAG